MHLGIKSEENLTNGVKFVCHFSEQNVLDPEIGACGGSSSFGSLTVFL